MKLSTISNKKSVRFEAEWNNEPFWFETKENALTPQVLQSFQDVGARPIEFAAALSAILTDWSIFLAEEGDFPPTFENLSVTPFDFLTFITEKVSETWAGDEKKPAKSRSSSPAPSHMKAVG